MNESDVLVCRAVMLSIYVTAMPKIPALRARSQNAAAQRPDSQLFHRRQLRAPLADSSRSNGELWTALLVAAQYNTWNSC